jgi:hypothetical protein
MRITVDAVDATDRHLVEVPATCAVNELKDAVLATCAVHELKDELNDRLPSHSRAWLVHAGRVLDEDKVTLPELGIVDGSTIWVLRPSKVISAFSLEQIHRICPFAQLDEHTALEPGAVPDPGAARGSVHAAGHSTDHTTANDAQQVANQLQKFEVQLVQLQQQLQQLTNSLSEGSEPAEEDLQLVQSFISSR